MDLEASLKADQVIPVEGGMSPTVGHLGKLIYQIESKALLLCSGTTEETKLQCYEHAVVVRTSASWCNCLNTRYLVYTIPRFKIVGCTFSKGKPGTNWWAILVFLVGWILFIIGLVSGGCKAEESYYSSYSYYGTSSSTSSYSEVNGGACTMSVIGGLMSFVIWPNMVLIPMLCFKDWHYLTFEVKSGSAGFFGKGRTLNDSFRFKGVQPDDMLLIDYVYGALDLAGKDAHVLSHFSEASLATPVVPVCNDNMTDFLRSSYVSSDSSIVKRSKKSKHKSSQISVAQV